MLTELAIRDLGVIADLRLTLPAGMTAVTGETGAGKTMLVEALGLLMGGRADPMLVRSGAEEAWVEGRFVSGAEELVLARAIPTSGRSRAYLNGRMAPVAALAEAGAGLVDLHGQHAHQSLLVPGAQRVALDAFAGVDHGPLVAARLRLREMAAELAALGGDERSRVREAELLRFQLAELEAARVSDPDEDEVLAAEEERLGDVWASREAAEQAALALGGDDGWADALGVATVALAGRPALAAIGVRLRSLSIEVADVASELRATAEALQDDPERLAWVRSRRRLLRDLQRKYGDNLAEVMAFGADVRSRLEALEHRAEHAARIEEQRTEAEVALRVAEAAVGAHRRAAAPVLAAAVEGHLRDLALPSGRLDVRVDADDPGDEVVFLLAANRGEVPLPLAKVASGGELARTMLALRLVLDEAQAPPTLVFDEVDAGIGGEAALSVGRKLAVLAERGEAERPVRQVLVVTHLPQVAAFADHQLAVRKLERDGRSVAEAQVVAGDDRVAELSRMLSGHPRSAAARGHAEELLAVAARDRAR